MDFQRFQNIILYFAPITKHFMMKKPQKSLILLSIISALIWATIALLFRLHFVQFSFSPLWVHFGKIVPPDRTEFYTFWVPSWTQIYGNWWFPFSKFENCRMIISGTIWDLRCGEILIWWEFAFILNSIFWFIVIFVIIYFFWVVYKKCKK